MKAVVLLFGALIAADIATTAYGLSIGASEGNPASAALGLFGTAAIKTALALPMLALIRLVDTRWHLVAMGALAFALPVAWNVTQLASLA